MTVALPTLDDVLSDARSAAAPMAASTPVQRASWLRSAADALEVRRSDLVPVAMAESHLAEARLSGELTRTAFQLRLFAERVEQGDFLDARIDHADASWPMGARPDIRRVRVPLGVVLVFAASNFPFAFSVAGGDTASALAAGCPVVVKANPGHPGLSVMVAETVSAALVAAGAPRGVLGLITSDADGAAAVDDPRVSAVGFTGSTRVGRLLFDRAAARPVPIPFYGELGSTNPAFVTPVAAQERAADVAAGFVSSFTLGAGQFCTKPGWLFVPAGSDVSERIVAAVGEVGGQTMLNERVGAGFGKTLTELAGRPDVFLATGELPDGDPFDGVRPTLLRTSVSTLLADPELIDAEVFGPAAVLVEYDDADQLAVVASGLPGQLTATVLSGTGRDEVAERLSAELAGHAGRVVWNEWPTGVTVSDAQQHGGPYPATTAPGTTSVGMAAIERWLRPVAFQNAPQEALPPALREDNPWGLTRLVDGVRH